MIKRAKTEWSQNVEQYLEYQDELSSIQRRKHLPSKVFLSEDERRAVDDRFADFMSAETRDDDEGGISAFVLKGGDDGNFTY